MITTYLDNTDRRARSLLGAARRGEDVAEEAAKLYEEADRGRLAIKRRVERQTMAALKDMEQALTVMHTINEALQEQLARRGRSDQVGQPTYLGHEPTEPRVVGFEEATRIYINRYTMEHVPEWARRPRAEGLYYAPQYATDREWYDNARFPGEEGHLGITNDCTARNPSWPLGEWLGEKPDPTNWTKWTNRPI